MNTKEEFFRKRVADKQREQLVVKARANILHDQNHHRSKNNIPNMKNNNCLKRKATAVEHEALERLIYLNQALELVDDLEPLFEVIKYFEEQALIAVESEEQATFLDTEIVATQLTRVFNSDYVARNWMNETESQVKSLQCSACRLICSYVISIRDDVLDFNVFEWSTITDLVKLMHIEDEPLTKATLNLLAAIFSIQYALISPADPSKGTKYIY